MAGRREEEVYHVVPPTTSILSITRAFVLEAEALIVGYQILRAC
jgi:hypothetical protein